MLNFLGPGPFHNKTALGTTLQRVQAAMNCGLEYGAGNIVAGNVLDEPAAGMNPNETGELMDMIRFVRDEFHMTILLIEHDMKLVS